MARRLVVPCLAMLALGLSAPAPARADAAVSDEIVVLRDGGLTRAERAGAGVAPERDLPLAGVEVVSAEGDRGAALAALRADPDVAWAEPNQPRRLSAEALAGLQWGLHNTGQSVWWHRGVADADIDAPEAWALSRGAGTTVAVADTGVDAGHPEFAGRIVPGWDFIDDDADPQDAHGHGTHVAGTIAAAVDGAGVIGVAPGAGIMPLRVLDANGGGNSADVAAAFAYAGDRGVRVVNASLGSPYPSQVERAAIRSHPGTLYVVAAGNGGSDAVGDDVDDATREYPCAHEEPNLICVGATTAGDTRAAFSNYGAASVDLSAPGQDIVSTYARGHASVLARHFATGDGYEIMEGTSMASPHVAGAAALASAVQPAWTGEQLRGALLDGADRLPALAGASLTGGRLNAAATVRIAAGRPAAPGGPEPGPLGPEVLEPGASAPAGGPSAGAPTISRVRLSGRPRLCSGRRGCQARAATVSFELAAAAHVTAKLQQRRPHGRGWHTTGSVRRYEPEGRTTWRLGRRLLGMRLRRGAWRLTLATTAGSAQRGFRVR